jgi:hypothetical protein
MHVIRSREETFGTCGGEERRVQGFGGGELNERVHLEEILVDGEDNLKRDLK